MKPIEHKADLAFLQAMRSVECRIPNAERLRSEGYLLALALRYGLFGAAAAHYLLESSDKEDERYVVESVLSWPQMVEQHLRFELIHRLPKGDPRDLPQFIARWSSAPVQHSVPLYRRMCPLETCLDVAAEDFLVSHSQEISRGWNWFQKRRALRVFADEARESIRFALNFFERRQLGLEEVPEIALLDE